MSSSDSKEIDKDLRMAKVVMLVSLLSYLSLAILTSIAIYYQIVGTIDLFKALEIMLIINLGHLLISSIRNSVLKGGYKEIHLLKASKVIVPKGEFININVRADADLYQKGITPTNALPKKECVFMVDVEIGEFQKAPLLTMSRTYHSKTSAEKLNLGMELSDKGFKFPVVAKSGELINFQFDSNGIVKKFAVEEFYIV